MESENKQKKSRKSSKIRRREIIEAGMQILTTEGARQFTAERIGKEVGITSGSIFRHFKSMDEILDSIVNRIEEIIFQDFPPKTDNPLLSLRLFFQARVNAISQYPNVSKLLLNSMLIPKGDSKNREKRLSEFKKRSKKFVIDSLKQAKKDDLLAEGISPEESSVVVFSVIFAIGHMGISPIKGQNKIESINRIWGILEKTLYKNSQNTKN